MAQKYDVFISYRRDDGAQYARILQLQLEKRGYKVFLDYEELTDGVFGDNIKEAINEAPIFIMVLTPQYLQRSMEKESWVREEIEMAINANKHFIPVDPDHKFNGVPTGTPSGIANIVGTHQHSAIDFGQALGATIELMVKNRIAPFITKRNASAKKWIYVFSAIIAIAILGTIFILKNQEPNEEGVQTYGKSYSEQLLKAANANDRLAQYYLGLATENGYGITADASQAVVWYQKAAEQNLDSAQVNLALCYLKGIGVTKDEKIGLHWLQKAADSGNSDAMINLGIYYMNQGDKSESQKWLKNAQEKGNEKANQLLQQLK
jgi:hypothetical protein